MEAGIEEERERLAAEESIMGEKCTDAREFILGLTEKLIALERREGVKDEINEVEGRLNYQFPVIAYEWADQKEFVDVCKITEVEAGIMVTGLRSLGKLFLEIQEASKVIGSKELEEKAKTIEGKLKRDILFLPSLYYD